MAMMTAGFSIHIHTLLQSLNGSNSQDIFRKLSLFAQCGTDESIVVLRTCLRYLEINKKVSKIVQIEAVSGLVFRYMLDKPNFCEVFSGAVTDINVDSLAKLSNALDLALHERVGLGLALLDSENPNIRTCGENYCMAQIKGLCASNVFVDSKEQIHNIMMFIHRSKGLAKHLDSFKHMLSLIQSKKGDQHVLSPLLSDQLGEKYVFRNLLAENYKSDFDSVSDEMEKGLSMEDVIKKFGCGCTIDITRCKAMLSLFSPLTEIMVARILGTIACSQTGLKDNQYADLTSCSSLGNGNFSDTPSLNSWNSNVLADSINQLVPGINWIHVNENLDFEGLYFPNEEAFSFFMSTYKYACQDAFPLHAICGSVWKNAKGQISFLKFAVSAPPEIFTFAHSLRQLKFVDAVHDHISKLGNANHAWLCLDLLEVLCQLAECNHANDVRLMLTQPLEHCPEVLLLGVAHIDTSSNLLQSEVSSIVFPKMLNSTSGDSMILYLWHVNPNILLKGFIDAYNTNPDRIGRILDICQELKILSPVLDMVPSYFGIRLASIGFRRELVDLEKWTSSRLIAYKDNFFEECLTFFKEIQSDASQDIYTEDTTPILMKVLQAHASVINSSQLVREMGKLVETFMPVTSATKSEENNEASVADGCSNDFVEKANSDLKKMLGIGNNNLSPSDGSSDEIKEEAYSYLRKLFYGELKIDTIIQMLTRFKESGDIREQSLFGRMIESLYEEYKFYPKYPEVQLKIAAVLFGSLIKHQLVTHLNLGIALRGILDALRKPSDSKMFVFGKTALEQFLERLVKWPVYCLHISDLRSIHPELVAMVEKKVANLSMSDALSDSVDQQHNFVQPKCTNIESPKTTVPSPGSSSTDLDPSSGSINSGRFGSTLNIETLLAAAERKESALEAPTSATQARISCIINSLSASNFEAIAKDFAKVLERPFYPWFAQNMVMKRASVEPNLHDLYLKFLDKVGSSSLLKEIERATYENCRILLESDLIKSSSEARSLLKNLGSWLGKITIGRNTALLECELDLKSLIIEAYEKDLMIAVIPFTSKILDSCQGSIIYRPPNAFTMGIIGLLHEIYTMPNMKMSPKFEIEVLFKKLVLDMNKVKPTSLLKDRVKEVSQKPDVKVDPPLEVTSSSDLGNHSKTPSQVSEGEFRIDEVIINPKLHSTGLFSHFQSVVPAAMEIALEDVKEKLLWSSVCTANQTTFELVSKDYALEEDDTLIHNAALPMVACLAGNLARVTCQEPLRSALSRQLRDSVQGLNNTSELLEEAVQLVTTDNLDLVCKRIEESASDMALQLNDLQMDHHLYLRREERKEEGSTYISPNRYTQDHISSLPESFRPKQGNLSPSKHRVYENFVKFTWKSQSVDASDALPADSSASWAGSTQNDSASSTHVEAGENISTDLEKGVSGSTPAPESHSVGTSIIEIVPGQPTANTEHNNVPEMVELNPACFSDRVSELFAEWHRICEHPGENDEVCAHYVSRLQQRGMLYGDDTLDRFFCYLTDKVVSCYLDTEMNESRPSQSSQQPKTSSFYGIDIYAKLVLTILKYFPVDQGSDEVSLLPKVLGITVRIIQKDEREKKSSFNARPYLRLFINWLQGLVSLEPVNDDANFQFGVQGFSSNSWVTNSLVENSLSGNRGKAAICIHQPFLDPAVRKPLVLSTFANAFDSLQPLIVPGFSFAWLELVSHKSFMPKLLTGNSEKGWPYMERLMVDLLQFLEASLKKAELEGPVHVLFKGTLRTLLVLAHDFPEFLCNYHFSFCDVIPTSCIQMRNVILAASPRNVKLSDPSNPNLKIDMLSEISQSPTILSEIDTALKASQLKGDVDAYLECKEQGSSFLNDLKQKLLLPQSYAELVGTSYNVPLINSLVLYVGMQAIQQLPAKSLDPRLTWNNFTRKSAASEIFRTLMMDLDTEGRYLFLNAIANQLRYPNSHTRYFSCALLTLFIELDQEVIQEQIARVLLERLVVNRPHPWGVQITFIEIIKNPRCEFWSKAFTRCTPEIERLFETIAQSCGCPRL